LGRRGSEWGSASPRPPLYVNGGSSSPSPLFMLMGECLPQAPSLC